MSDKRQPWMKFYPSDWRADPRLRMCSLAARGLWMDMIALMHEAEPYGHLLINGKTPDTKQLASLEGVRPGEIQFLLNELESAGVFSRTGAGVIYSRRMVSDKARSDEGREAVSRRWSKTNKGTNEQPITPPNSDPIRSPTTQKPEARSQKPEEEERGERASAPPPPSDDDLLPVAFDQTDIGQAVRAFNAVAERIGLPRVQKITDARRKALRKRLVDVGGLDGWAAALTKLEASAFCRGVNDRGWVADFDFLMRESSFVKLMEGKYDDRTNPDGGGFNNGFAELAAKGGM
jgi:hypothetical protein